LSDAEAFFINKIFHFFTTNYSRHFKLNNIRPLSFGFPLFPFKVCDQGHGAGFRCGFCPGVAVWGEFFREALQAPALPFGTDTAREPASRVEGKLKGISTLVDYDRFGNSSHSASP
jgi:hypothetical protein